MKLYEIAIEYQRLIEAIESEEIPEEAIADTLESITSILEEKVDNIACLIKNLTAEKAAIDVEKANLEKRSKSKEKQIDRFKEYLSDVLLKSGYSKLETARNKITFRKSEKVTIDDEAAFIEWAKENNEELLTIKSSTTINKTAIKKSLANGEEIAGAHIEKNSNIQIN